LVRKFDTFYEDYNNKWSNRNEEYNHEQKFDEIMVR